MCQVDPTTRIRITLNGHPSVYRHDLAGNVAGSGSHKKARQPTHVFRLAKTPKRNSRM